MTAPIDPPARAPAGGKARVLAVTSIFPNALEPSWAPYNQRQLCELGRLCRVEVLALIPWFPGARALCGDRLRAGRLYDVPRRWAVDGLEVEHPRVLYLPRVGRRLSGPSYTLSLLASAWRRRGRVDVVLGAFGYPDAWAAVALSRLMGVPAVVKVHGTDVNLLPVRFGRELHWALSQAAAVVGPSRPLVARAVALGANRATSRVIPNGVDLELFRPAEKDVARRALGQPRDGRLLLYVGRLEPRKGVGELLEALELLRAAGRPRLVLIGDGEGERRYRALCAARELPALFTGALPHAEVARWLGAADLLVLPSWAEGTPNVVLEALACGRPVVATRVGGIPDVVASPRLGELSPVRDPAALAAAIERVLARDLCAAEVRAAAPLCSWADSARALYDVIERAREG